MPDSSISMPESPIAELVRLIQLSVAPVFLLTGAATLLNVLGIRLGRIVDRTRILADQLRTLPKDQQVRSREELQFQLRRRRLISRAIAAVTGSALIVCVFIGSAFVAFFLDLRIAPFIAALFTLSMVGLIIALVLFLREILLASATLDIDLEGPSQADRRPLPDEVTSSSPRPAD